MRKRRASSEQETPVSKDDSKNPRGHPPDAPLAPQLAQLRRRTEQKAQALNSLEIDAQWPAEARRMLQEQRVHQIELEMQNEALRSARERLEASRAHYFDLYELAPVGYCTLSREGLILEANRGAATLFGVPRSALAGQRLFGFILNDDEEIFYFLVRNLSITGRPQTCELRMTKKDAKLFWARLDVALGVDEGGAAGYRVVISNITRHKRVEQALRQSEEHLLLAERLAHVGHWHWEVQANQWSWSEEVYRISGQPPNYKPDYRGFLRMVVPEDRERVRRATRNCLAGKTGGSLEFQVARPNRDVRTVTSTFEVLLDGDGSPRRVFGTCQDVTDTKRAQEESFARQKLESLGTLTKGIAHDFGNLLGGVLAQAELALAELDSGWSCKEELQTIHGVAVRGSEIVRQLMIYAGVKTVVIGPVDLSKIVEEVLALLSISVSKHATLETDLGQDLPAVRTNAVQIRQIVMNLVTNASEAIGERDGVIRVTTRCVKMGPDSSTAMSDRLADRDYLQLEVYDTGCGIPQQMRANVFDPFFTTKSACHGLGLAVVQGVVRGLGGAIHIASQSGKGTTVQILLPCAEGEAEASETVSRVGLLPTRSNAVLSKVPPPGVQTVRDVGKVREINGARWIDAPTVEKDMNTIIGVQR
jgi:PAS domain S-box-containing protein